MACKRRSRTRIHVRQKLYRSQSRSTTWKNSEVLPFPFFLSFVHRYYATSLRNPPSVLTPWNARSFALLNFKTRFRWRNIRFRSVLRYCSPSTFPLREERGQEMRIFIIQGRGFFTFDDLNYRSIFFKYSNLRDIHFGISFFKIFQILSYLGFSANSMEFLKALLLFLFFFPFTIFVTVNQSFFSRI